jgi:hypothetical protein
LTVRQYSGPALDMGDDEIVTHRHHFLAGEKWISVGKLNLYPETHYEGTIHNLHILCSPDDDTDAPDTEHSYTLANGRVVHNFFNTA